MTSHKACCGKSMASPGSVSISAVRAQRRTVASFRGVSIASNAAMRAQRRTVASFRENFKLPARLWERREVLRCVDLHCGGEPATVVFGGGGVADAPGATMFAKRAHVMERMDRWREVLLHEPRGYPCSNVDYLVEPTLAGADAGFVIAEQAKAIAIARMLRMCFCFLKRMK